jgi:hypothetical protein
MGERVSFKGPPSTLLGKLVGGHSVVYTDVFRFELSPGNYAINSLICNHHHSISIFHAWNKKIKPIGPKMSLAYKRGLAYFTVGVGEVISGGSLDTVGPPDNRSLRVRPLSARDMGYVQRVYPDEAAKLKHRLVSPFP